MRPSKTVECKTFSCIGVNSKSFMVPNVNIDPEKIRMIMISECAPASTKDYFYSKGDPLFAKTTIQAFTDAGKKVNNIEDLLEMGVYLTTAVK